MRNGGQKRVAKANGRESESLTPEEELHYFDPFESAEKRQDILMSKAMEDLWLHMDEHKRQDSIAHLSKPGNLEKEIRNTLKLIEECRESIARHNIGVLAGYDTTLATIKHTLIGIQRGRRQEYLGDWLCYAIECVHQVWGLTKAMEGVEKRKYCRALITALAFTAKHAGVYEDRCLSISHLRIVEKKKREQQLKKDKQAKRRQREGKATDETIKQTSIDIIKTHWNKTGERMKVITLRARLCKNLCEQGYDAPGETKLKQIAHKKLIDETCGIPEGSKKGA